MNQLCQFMAGCLFDRFNCGLKSSKQDWMAEKAEKQATLQELQERQRPGKLLN